MHLVMGAAVVFSLHMGFAVVATSFLCTAGYVVAPVLGILDPPRWWVDAGTNKRDAGDDDVTNEMITYTAAREGGE